MGQGIRVYAVEPLSEHVERSYWRVRWEAFVLAGFSLLALTLAAIGLYAAVAHRVYLRTPEFGIRLALGARRLDIVGGVVRQGLWIVSYGIGIGALLSVGVLELTISFQEDIERADPVTYVATCLLWLAVGLLASYVPARRAAGVDPAVAFRCE